MVSTYVAFTILDSYNVPFLWAAALTFLFAILLGIFFEIVFLRQAKDPTVIGLIIITLGFEMILMGFAGWKWGPDQRSFPFQFQISKPTIFMASSSARLTSGPF